MTDMNKLRKAMIMTLIDHLFSVEEEWEIKHWVKDANPCPLETSIQDRIVSFGRRFAD